MDVAVIMTCHNRRETTVACLEKLAAQKSADWSISLYVTDDGSTDGTRQAIARSWPGARILDGDGSLYWAAGMALAERAAVQHRPDFLLWLNDDTHLNLDALSRLLRAATEEPEGIVVGAVIDPETGVGSYGGCIRLDYHPQRFEHLPISDASQSADTFNGNVVLIPWTVRQQVGPIDGLFAHAYADFDYGLRARRLGFPVSQAPGHVGTCSRVPTEPSPHGGPLAKWRNLQQPKAMPWRSQARFLRRHSDWRWPILFVGGQVRRTFL